MGSRRTPSTRRSLGALVGAAVLLLGLTFAATPARAGLDDCQDAVEKGWELLEKGTSLATNQTFLGCVSKLASLDVVSFGVNAIFVGWGASGGFDSEATCNAKVKETIMSPLVAALDVALKAIPAVLKDALNAVLEPLGTSVDDILVKLETWGVDLIYDFLRNAVQPIFAYIDCGCSIAGNAIELGKDAIDLLNETEACVNTFKPDLEAWFGGKQIGAQNANESTVAPCPPGDFVADYYAYGWSNGEWVPLPQFYQNCVCGWDGTGFIYAHAVGPPGKEIFQCVCPNGQGYENGTCGTCEKTGLVNSNGTCPACDFGKGMLFGQCLKCRPDQYIVDGACVQWDTASCPAGFIQKIVASPDPYAPGTLDCEERVCPKGSIYNSATGKCDKCSANEMAVYSDKTMQPVPNSTSGQVTEVTSPVNGGIGECRVCQPVDGKDTYSSPGSTTCFPICEPGADNTLFCIPSHIRPGGKKKGGLKPLKPSLSILDKMKPFILGNTVPVGSQNVYQGTAVPAEGKRTVRCGTSMKPNADGTACVRDDSKSASGVLVPVEKKKAIKCRPGSMLNASGTACVALATAKPGLVQDCSKLGTGFVTMAGGKCAKCAAGTVPNPQHTACLTPVVARPIDKPNNLLLDQRLGSSPPLQGSMPRLQQQPFRTGPTSGGVK